MTARFHFGQICCARHTLHAASKLKGNRRPKQAKNAHVVHNCTETVDAMFYLPSDIRFCSVGRVSSAIRSPCYVSFPTRVCFLASSFSLSCFMCLVFYSHSSRHASAQLPLRHPAHCAGQTWAFLACFGLLLPLSLPAACKVCRAQQICPKWKRAVTKQW